MYKIAILFAELKLWETMSNYISDSEVLEPNVSSLQDNEPIAETSASPIPQRNDIQEEEDDNQQTFPQTPPLRKRKAKQRKEKDRRTRRTLRDLNHQLDQINQSLQRAQPIQYRDYPQRQQQPIIGPRQIKTTARTYELTPQANRLAFRIFDTANIRWLQVEQKIIIKTPRRYTTAHFWRNSNGHAIQIPTQATDFAKFIYIPGVRVFHNQGMQFYFKPLRVFRDLLNEGVVTISKGIHLKLTLLAATQHTFMPKGIFIGELYVITNLHVNSF